MISPGKPTSISLADTESWNFLSNSVRSCWPSSGQPPWPPVACVTAAGGYAEITPVDGTIQEGDMVVVGTETNPEGTDTEA